MKIILSRKGMDSACGGYPSIVIDSKLISLPIPSISDTCRYSEIFSGYKDYNMQELILMINKKIKIKNWELLADNTKCHLDPDIVYESLQREVGWKGSLGQVGAAQTVLKNNNICKGDIFIFFGWFKEYKDLGHKLKPEPKSGKHIIYGYLQIGDILNPDETNIPHWLSYHPHNIKMIKNNCIYIAKETCSWNNNICGYGMFEFNKKLLLTKSGCSRSKWLLPDFFKDVSIAYHSKNSWKNDYFQSANRGQEFVVSEDKRVTDWAIKLIEEFGCKINKKEILA